MPYPYQGNPLFDTALQISITQLKKGGLMKEGEITKGVIEWKRDGEIYASINVIVSMKEFPYKVVLAYERNGHKVTSFFDLYRMESNLGKGHYYFFICPVTGQRARKLYLIGNYFLHREAYSGCMYAIQTRSRSDLMGHRYNVALQAEQRMEERYYRPTYAGKPTRTAKRIQKKSDWIECVWWPTICDLSERFARLYNK